MNECVLRTVAADALFLKLKAISNVLGFVAIGGLKLEFQ